MRIIEHISLDGAIQAHGRPNEGGDDYAHGGWTAPYRSAVGAEADAGAQGKKLVLLPGRRTYDNWGSLEFLKATLPYTLDNAMSLVADPSSAAVDSHLDYIVGDIEAADTVLVHRLAADIAQAGLVVVHMVVVDIVLAEEQQVDCHTLHKNAYQEHFADHMQYKRLVQLRRVVLVPQERSYSAHNGYKTQCLSALPADRQDKDVS